MGFYEFMCHECWKWGNESSMASSLPSGCGRTRSALQDPALRTRKAGGEMRSFMVPPKKTKMPHILGKTRGSTWFNMSQLKHSHVYWMAYIYILDGLYIYIVTSFEGIFIPLKLQWQPWLHENPPMVFCCEKGVLRRPRRWDSDHFGSPVGAHGSNGWLACLHGGGSDGSRVSPDPVKPGDVVKIETCMVNVWWMDVPHL
jgi:hypothetical protein